MFPIAAEEQQRVCLCAEVTNVYLSAALGLTPDVAVLPFYACTFEHPVIHRCRLHRPSPWKSDLNDRSVAKPKIADGRTIGIARGAPELLGDLVGWLVGRNLVTLSVAETTVYEHAQANKRGGVGRGEVGGRGGAQYLNSRSARRATVIDPPA